MRNENRRVVYLISIFLQQICYVIGRFTNSIKVRYVIVSFGSKRLYILESSIEY